MSDLSPDVRHGDCLDVMQDMPAESCHAVVTDPPYGLSFMGQSWDEYEPAEYQEWCRKWATEALRVLKPGGHLVAFSGSRTFHRLAVGVETAGFTVRDVVMWLYGSGFPKGNDIGKDIDKKQGTAEDRDVVGSYVETSGFKSIQRTAAAEDYRPEMYYDDDPDTVERTAPASTAAREWDGWNTQLKPAFEPIVLARKPLAEDSIAEQVLATGTGALNIGECRIGTEERTNAPQGSNPDLYGDIDPETVEEKVVEGRYPPNAVLDEQAAGLVDQQSTTAAGASRFFYTSKASQAERTIDGAVENEHKTVKPVDLIEWLVTLVSAEGQTVLDPFAGSGTTLLAAFNLGRASIGIEQDSEYVEIARQRIAANEAHPDVVGTSPSHIYDDPLDW